MLTAADIITVPISAGEYSFLQRHARRAELGGRSHIRGATDRADKLKQDQLVGMVGAFAGTKTLFGDVRLFRLQRFFADLYPSVGDGGSDIPGSNVDFKSSAITANKDLLSYRLAVRQRERHAAMNYVLVLVEIASAIGLATPPATAHLVGWASEEMLPQTPEADGPFAGAYTLKAAQLNPLMRLTWFDERPAQVTTTEVNVTDIRW